MTAPHPLAQLPLAEAFLAGVCWHCGGKAIPLCNACARCETCHHSPTCPVPLEERAFYPHAPTED
jgi:hypothetical protein